MLEYLKKIGKEDCMPQFNQFYDLLIEWNNKFNLTAITERKEVDQLHFVDSILPMDLIPIGAKVADIGAGAGFPSIPLKIVRTDLDMTMVDSLKKRVGFLEEVIYQLILTNITAVHSRAEDLTAKEKFDVVLARAVARLNTLAELTLPFVKIGGFVICYKANNIEEEIAEATKAISVLGGKISKIVEIKLPYPDSEGNEIIRKFVLIKKIKSCDKIYPRGGNKPKNIPLK